MKTVWSSLLVITFIIVVGMVVGSSLDFQQCIQTYGKDNPSTEHFKQGVSAFVVPIPTYRHCIGAYVVDKNPAITALSALATAIFTTVLGVFTISLAKATRESAKAASLSARAAVASQAPVVILTDVGVGDRGTQQATKDFPAKKVWMNLGPSQMFRIRIRFRNFGRTPAVVDSICLDYIVSDSLPDAPQYKNIIKTIAAIRPDEQIKITEPPGIGIENYIRLPAADLRAISDKTKFLWIFGHIYFEDFLHARYEIGFCGRWTDTGFQADGPGSYTYERKTEKHQV